MPIQQPRDLRYEIETDPASNRSDYALNIGALVFAFHDYDYGNKTAMLGNNLEKYRKNQHPWLQIKHPLRDFSRHDFVMAFGVGAEWLAKDQDELRLDDILVQAKIKAVSILDRIAWQLCITIDYLQDAD
ncbi:hypothetical protein SLS62_002975 [Diatrype stigma]|uniref:Uncharacterized protein n=1 Tax=Diatrype stigma TaxID=117547 RepID=A0AAN9UTV7_9PEZI